MPVLRQVVDVFLRDAAAGCGRGRGRGRLQGGHNCFVVGAESILVALAELKGIQALVLEVAERSGKFAGIQVSVYLTVEWVGWG